MGRNRTLAQHRYGWKRDLISGYPLPSIGGEMQKVDRDREAVITALLEGINSARYASPAGSLNELEESHLMAQVALASLESAGFQVIRRTD